MRILTAVLLLVACVLPARADEQAPACDLPAVRFGTDARLLTIYDGLRRGLEKAHLPRVCMAPVKDDDADVAAFERRLVSRAETLAKEGSQAPVAFAFGDRASEHLVRRATSVPRVFVVTRYSLRGRPLAPLPEPEGPSAVVYAETRLERVADVLAQMLETETPRVALAWKDVTDAMTVRLDEITEATGIVFTTLEAGDAEAVLHLRLGIGEELLPLRDTIKAARTLGVAVVSDDPARFRLGIVPVVLTTHPELVGRYAAEAARLLVRHPDETLSPRSVVVTRVLVDLKAADATNLSLPLGFLASAFELTRGLKRAGTDER